jgi:hypothetical protein
MTCLPSVQKILCIYVMVMVLVVFPPDHGSKPHLPEHSSVIASQSFGLITKDRWGIYNFINSRIQLVNSRFQLHE